jgi:subtilisin family serine protease
MAAVYDNETPLLPTLLGRPLSTAQPPKLTPLPSTANRIGVLIKTRRALVRSDLPGVSVNFLAENLVSARVTLDELRRLTTLPEVAFIEASYRLEPHIDKSVSAVGGRFLHETPPRATGQGVIVGLVDTGIDWSHRDFRTDGDGDGFEESSRILWLWDQTEAGLFGSPRKVPFGTEYTREEISVALRTSSGLVNERDESGHGTHVTGIALGDGSVAGGTFVGMAPQSEMIFVKTSYSSTDIVEGVRYVFDKAEWLGKPAVVNLSLGGHFGPHDGTSLFEHSLEAFLTKPGRAIIASAGNDGDQNVHIGGYLRPREAITFTFVPNEETVYLSIWYSGSANFTVSVTSPGVQGPAQTVLAQRGQGDFVRTPDGRVELDNSSGGLDPRNRDRAIAVSLEGVQPGSLWRITLTDQGTGGAFDGWPGLSTMGSFLEGDARSTITEPATAKKIIAVGAYTTKIYWQGADGEPHRFTDAQSEGQLAPFSARGPTRDVRVKPDLTAPGTAIVSALAQNSEVAQSAKLIVPGRAYVAMQGTSMAAPHVAGAVALLLQAKPYLTTEEIFDQLTSTALRDAFTLNGPLTAWGAGKLQADRGFETIGLKEQLDTGRPALKIGPNPAYQTVTFFYSTVGAPSTTVELTIFDLVGRPVYSTSLPSHSQRFQWALRDDRGALLPPGLYIVVVTADGRGSAPQPLIVRR